MTVSECVVIGAGFLGSHVSRHLAEQGHSVKLYSRSFNGWLEQGYRSSSGSIDLIEGHLPAGAGLLELIDAADVVFYLAGSSTPVMGHSDPAASVTNYVVPAAAAFDLMRRTSTRRIVVPSSGGTVYGVVTELPTPESHPTRPISLHGHNALTVERYATFFANQYGFEPVVLRYANPYGPGQIPRRGQGVIAAWCDALKQSEDIIFYGSGDTRRDLVFVDDVAAATVAAGLHAPAPCVYNVGSGSSYSLDEVVRAVFLASGRTASIRRMQGRPVDVPVTQLDCSRLNKATGWRALTSLAEGVRATWEWTLSLP